MSTILVVEDNISVRITLEAVLKQQGIEVISCSQASDAFGFFKSHNIDLVITDIIMPGMNGVDFSKKIKNTYPSMKILAISGGGYTRSEESTLELIKPFADETLEKPFSTEELNNKLFKLQIIQ